MKFMIEPLTDAAGNKYWLIYEHGLFHDPTAVIDDHNMRGIVSAVIGKEITINDLGQKVKAYRKAKRYSQKEMAALAGISRNYLSQIERGAADNLSVDVMNRLRMAIGE